MGKKIICESCGTIFPFEKVKDMSVCPVCNASFDDEADTEYVDNEDVVQDETDEGSLYFENIVYNKTNPEWSKIRLYCGECGDDIIEDLNIFDEIVDKDYVLSNEIITIKCENCGKEHKQKKVLYKERAPYKPPLPRCPVCNSIMLNKIKASSKILAAAFGGMYALPYNSKTYECMNCGYRF